MTNLPFSSLLAIMAIAFMILEKESDMAGFLSAHLNKIWFLAELILFSIIGAEVDVSLAMSVGLIGLLIFFLGLFARSLGVCISLWKSNFTYKERLFCIIAYLPKATVQAAIGGVALTYGIDNGALILSMAVLSILVTAPIGSIGIKLTAEKLLKE